MKIPFYKPSIGDDEINEVVDTLRSGWLTTGPKTKQFEQEFAAYIARKHAVALNSCTAALHLALDPIGRQIEQTNGGDIPTMPSPPAPLPSDGRGLRRTLPDQGGEGRWLSVGSSADITCFSFYANKTITTGEGGMACTNNDEYADRMRIMSLHGISRDAWKRFTAEGSWYYEIIAPGFKYNLTDIASAIGVHQLRKADELHRKRTALAQLYSA